MTASPTIVTAGEARRIALNAQGLLGPRRGGPAATLRQLGGVQLDTISVLARSHELVAYARHGSIRRAAIEEAYWGTSSTTFEYWSHAACILPLEDWPFYAITRAGPAWPAAGAGIASKMRRPAVPTSWLACAPKGP